MTASVLLEADDVHLSFGATPALRGANLQVEIGEVVALVGPSGSGKSTLLHCLAGILRPDSGAVRFEGHDLRELSDAARTRLRRQRFGFVFQFGSLVPELTAVENVALPLRLAGVRRRDAEARADDWLRRLDVAGQRDQRPGAMSGGQQQRVAVARALITEPGVVFADEPTGALDSMNGELVLDHLLKATRAQGAALVLVTHEARIAAYADRDVVLANGTDLPVTQGAHVA